MIISCRNTLAFPWTHVALEKKHVNGMRTSDAFVGGNSGTSSTGNEVIEVVSIIYIRR